MKKNKDITKEDKQLLFIDLSARLPWRVKCFHPYGVGELDSIEVKDYGIHVTFKTPDDNYYSIEECKPYLRKLSSMTKEEKKELWELLKKLGLPADAKRLDWFNKKHFDYRINENGEGLIERGLALEAPEGMYG